MKIINWGHMVGFDWSGSRLIWVQVQVLFQEADRCAVFAMEYCLLVGILVNVCFLMC